jgi:hypothetical protein
MDNHDLRRLFAWLVSGRAILWIFASCVFGAYVGSLEAALLESTGYYGPMNVFTTGQLANMVLPIQISIYVWILGSVLLLCGQLTVKPIQMDTVVIGVGSLAISLLSQWTVGTSLSVVRVPWFVSYLGLTDATKLLVGVVSAFALAYVVASPLVWSKKARKEIADDLRELVVSKALAEVSKRLKTDGAKMRVHDMSVYVSKGSIAVIGLYTTRDGRSASFTCTFTQPDLNVAEVWTTTAAEER